MTTIIASALSEQDWKHIEDILFGIGFVLVILAGIWASTKE